MGWVALDTAFYEELLLSNRPLTRLEAAFILTHEMNFDKPWNIKKYSRMWQWSRCKVRKFVTEILSKDGCVENGVKNIKRHPVRLIGNGSQSHKDTPLKLKRHPGVNNVNGFSDHKDTVGSKKTPLNLTGEQFLASIKTPF